MKDLVLHGLLALGPEQGPGCHVGLKGPSCHFLRTHWDDELLTPAPACLSRSQWPSYAF